MKKTFTLIKRALLCCSFGCFATLYADAQRSIQCQFSQEFIDEMKKEDILRDKVLFRLSTSAEALDTLEIKSFSNYESHLSYYMKRNPNLLPGDSVKFYFSLYSDHVIIEQGEFMVDTATLHKNSWDNPIRFNPLPGTKKMIAKCPTDIDGKPISAIAGFITKHKDGTTSCYADFGFSYYSPEGALKLNATADGKNCAPFWIKSDLDYVYVVAPQTEVNTPQYLMSVQDVSGKAYPDTLTCDYSTAKKVMMGLKDLEGNYIDLKNHRIFNKITNAGGHMDDRTDKYFELRHFPQYDKWADSLMSIEFYALPGKHYVALDGYTDGDLYPAGLEGIITVNDQEVEQRFDQDFSHFITLHKKGNAPFALSKFVCRNKVTDNVLNKAEERLAVNKWGCPYYSREAVVDGEEVLRIWPSFGYETIDIELDGITYQYDVKGLDIKSTKDYTFDMTDLNEMKISLPHFMLQNGFVRGDGNEFRNLIDPERKNPYLSRDFDEPAVYNAFFSEGQHQVDVFLKNKLYYSETVNFPEDANKTMNVGWKNSAVYSVDAKGIDPTQIETAGGTYVDSIQKGSQVELFYVYKEPGEVQYKVNGPQENYIPLMGKFNVGEERTHTVLSFAEHKEFRLINTRNTPSFVSGDHPIWYGKNGEECTFEWKRDERGGFSCYAQPGRFYIPIASAGKRFPRSSTIYPFEVEFNDTDSLKLSDEYCTVRFTNGEQMLTYENFDRYQTGPNYPLDADVHIYALNFTPTQKEMELRIHRGVKKEGAYLLPGFYRAEERSGKKVYFEVKAEDRGMSIDFANPPMPPVGIEEVADGDRRPAAFYDMSGRLLDGPRKGINIVRMQNGQVKKFIMK